MPYLWIILIGTLGGILGGLLGVGGGLIFVPFLILMKNFDPHMAVGTSLAVVVPAAAMGVFRHSQAGMVDWKTALIIAICAVIGAWLGATLSLRLDTVLLRRVFAVFLLILSVKMFFPNG